MVAAFESLTTLSERGRPVVEKTLYSFKPPGAQHEYKITSYKCPAPLYQNQPSPFPAMARGLFVHQREGTTDWKIVARGYDKFFNVGEVQATSWQYLKDHSSGPYEVTLKENGCIIFVSALDDFLLVTSKHALGAARDTFTGKPSLAQKGEEWLRRHLHNAGKSAEELTKYLEEHNATAVFELVDDDFEEHILEYPPERRGLWLHGINYNLPEFRTWPSVDIAPFAQQFGFFKVEALVVNTIEEVMDFTDQVRKTGSHGGRAVEGFVVRCHDQNRPSDIHFFKVKYDEPYLMFREWREVTNRLLSQKGMGNFKPRFELTRQYVDWARQKMKSNPELFAQCGQQKGIIHARKLFLQERNLPELGSRIVEEACKTTKEYGAGHATLKAMEEGADNEDASLDFPKLFYVVTMNFDVGAFLDGFFAGYPDEKEFWDKLVKDGRIDKQRSRGWHMTLCMNKPAYQDLIDDCEGVLLGKGKGTVEAVGSDGVKTAPVDLHLEEVVWDDRAMAITIKAMNPPLGCANRIPHITVATASDDIKPFVSNEVIQPAFAHSASVRRLSFGANTSVAGGLKQILLHPSEDFAQLVDSPKTERLKAVVEDLVAKAENLQIAKSELEGQIQEQAHHIEWLTHAKDYAFEKLDKYGDHEFIITDDEMVFAQDFENKFEVFQQPLLERSPRYVQRYKVKGSKGRQVVIKYWSRPALIANSKHSTRMSEGMRTEILLTSTLDHSNIVQFLGLVITPLKFAMIFESMEEDLYEFAQRHGVISESLLKPIIRDVTNGLRSLHSRGLVHRDLKSDNVLISRAGTVAKITDFGLMAELWDVACTDIVGTPGYIAPETFKGEGQSKCGDIWALGIITAQCLSGESPFAEYAESRPLTPYRRPSSFDGHMVSIEMGVAYIIMNDPETWETFGAAQPFLEKLLETDPTRRPSADEVLQLAWLRLDGRSVGTGKGEFGDGGREAKKGGGGEGVGGGG
ncbi:hypothetical protein HDV00_004828 [Rhizophlyctis rosea]|nr:hypothetical protein HDV00_004828 [Rhizophlyctis rosea]